MSADTEDSLYINLCRLKELFSGRFTTEEAAVLLHHKDGHLDEAVAFVLHNEATAIREILESERATWTEVNNLRLGQTKQRPGVLERARSGHIDTSARLYACKTCDKVWWKRVPDRKKVSRCHRCRVRYEAVPRDMEWGWAEFNCTSCGRQFGGWCAMNMKCPCYGCHVLTAPTRIVPSDERQNTGGGSRLRHSCAAPDCPGRDMYRGPLPETGLDNLRCVHPGSLRMRNLPQAVHPSLPHDSTGSTVDTFLSQTDITKSPEIFFPILPAVPEQSGDDDSEASENGSH